MVPQGCPRKAHCPPSVPRLRLVVVPADLPAKGPQWEKFGWQVAQQGSRPDQAEGQLITDPSGRYVMSRSPAAIPFAGCGPGVTGWVEIGADGTLGCMNCTATPAHRSSHQTHAQVCRDR